MSNHFPTAPVARQQGINSNTVIQEISILKLAVISAIAEEAVTVLTTATSLVTLNNTSITGSPMTRNPYYYDAWKLSNSAVKTAEMNEIINYFTGLGYAIGRKSNISSAVTTSATVAIGGTGTVAQDYVAGDILTLVGIAGVAPTFTVASTAVGLAVYSASQAGTWVTGDTVTISTGFVTPAVLTITAEAGLITAVTVTTPGSRTVLEALTDPVTYDSTTSVAGTSATFDLRMDVATVSHAAPVLVAVIPANPVATTSSGSGIGATLTVSYDTIMNWQLSW